MNEHIMHTIESVHVDVTPEDILLGSMDCDHCPVARALQRALNNYVYKGVRVWAYKIEIMGYDYEIPYVVANFIKLYDTLETKHQAKPFSFEMIVRKDDANVQGG